MQNRLEITLEIHVSNAVSIFLAMKLETSVSSDAPSNVKNCLQSISCIYSLARLAPIIFCLGEIGQMLKSFWFSGTVVA